MIKKNTSNIKIKIIDIINRYKYKNEKKIKIKK
jgi:hypothetical protein